MNRYNVFNAGFPKDAEEIVAGSPKEAALVYFKKNRYLNGIIVKAKGVDELFHWHHFVDEFPGMEKEDLEYRAWPEAEPAKKMPFWKEYLFRLILGNTNFNK